jgi:hypothetical protein
MFNCIKLTHEPPGPAGRVLEQLPAEVRALESRQTVLSFGQTCRNPANLWPRVRRTSFCGSSGAAGMGFNSHDLLRCQEGIPIEAHLLNPGRWARNLIRPAC